MATGVFIVRSAGLTRTVAWAARFARARDEELVVLAPGPQGPMDEDGDDVSQAASGALEAARASRRDDAPAVRLVGVGKSPDADGLIAQLEAHDVTLLVLPRFELPRLDRADDALDVELITRAPCAVMLLRPEPEDRPHDRVLTPVVGDDASIEGLALAAAVAADLDATVTALFVEPDVGEDAAAVGRRILDRSLRKVPRPVRDRVEPRVVVNDKVTATITAAADEQPDPDIILLGTSTTRWRGRRPRKDVTSLLFRRDLSCALGVLMPSPGTRDRVRRRLRDWLSSPVPQLERERRLELVEHLQSSSEWNFDFIALTTLSTSIAALGLAQGSAAVVIGAMLVAPLMTPLVGAGLAIVQGNLRLIRRASRTVTLGFLTAFGIATALGLAMTGPELTAEIRARTQPGVLDLGVAGLSGVAAAYALTRAHLSAALPGVAIAAALVPPIATGGLTLAAGEPRMMLGAVLLFASNIVAIILGAAVSLWFTGVRATHVHGPIAGRWILGVVAPLVALSALFSTPTFRPILQPRPEPFEAKVAERLERDGHELVSTRRLDRDGEPVIELRVKGLRSPGDVVARDLAAIIRHFETRPVVVRLIPEVYVEATAR